MTRTSSSRVGTRLGDFTTGSRNLFRNPAAKVLTINVNSFDAHKMNALAVVADARETLKALTAALGASALEDRLHGRSGEGARGVAQGRGPAVHGGRPGGALPGARSSGSSTRSSCPKNAIVVGASGSLPGDLQRVWRTRAEDSYHMEYGFSCMGYEIAAALGARMAAPDREVFALVGDGSYVMLHSELLTAIQEDIKIHVIVFDNAGYQCIDNLQQSQGIVKFGNDLRKRDPATGRLTGSLIKLDFAKNGESYGARGYSAGTLEQFRAAVKSALAGNVATVIDVKVTPKSMTHDYESWWRVGTAQVSENPKVEEAARKIAREVETRTEVLMRSPLKQKRVRLAIAPDRLDERRPARPRAGEHLRAVHLGDGPRRFRGQRGGQQVPEGSRSAEAGAGPSRPA